MAKIPIGVQYQKKKYKKGDLVESMNLTDRLRFGFGVVLSCERMKGPDKFLYTVSGRKPNMNPSLASHV